ncbi:MAG: hypothetical protein HRU14_14125, partial [Planctomycetes bacterium]|nr:hypothetical protein [Planctomycetota bacterium]
MSGVIPLSACAIIVNDGDNVAVVKSELQGGEHVELPGGSVVEVTGPVDRGHRFAIAQVPEGEHLRQYGQPIGTSLGIGVGDPVSPANMSNDVPVVRDLPADLSTPAPDY